MIVPKRYILGASPGSFQLEQVTVRTCLPYVDARMEALRTQIDSLRWEVDRLDAENRKLREWGKRYWLTNS